LVCNRHFFPSCSESAFAIPGHPFGFQLSAAIGGGLSPIIATVLAEKMGGTARVSMLLILLAVVTFVATLFARETRDEPLHR
jgi:MFS transporter, MHS family, shikimate and dehydroshikimate transport protein